MTYLLRKPDSSDKLKILGEVAQFDVCGFPSVFTRKNRSLSVSISSIQQWGKKETA